MHKVDLLYMLILLNMNSVFLHKLNILIFIFFDIKNSVK